MGVAATLPEFSEWTLTSTLKFSFTSISTLSPVHYQPSRDSKLQILVNGLCLYCSFKMLLESRNYVSSTGSKKVGSLFLNPKSTGLFSSGRALGAVFHPPPSVKLDPEVLESRNLQD